MRDGHAARLYDAVNTWGADDEFFLHVATAGDSGPRLGSRLRHGPDHPGHRSSRPLGDRSGSRSSIDRRCSAETRCQLGRMGRRRLPRHPFGPSVRCHDHVCERRSGNSRRHRTEPHSSRRRHPPATGWTAGIRCTRPAGTGMGTLDEGAQPQDHRTTRGTRPSLVRDDQHR